MIFDLTDCEHDFGFFSSSCFSLAPRSAVNQRRTKLAARVLSLAASKRLATPLEKRTRKWEKSQIRKGCGNREECSDLCLNVLMLVNKLRPSNVQVGMNRWSSSSPRNGDSSFAS
jgi:hypothetical protein